MIFEEEVAYRAETAKTIRSMTVLTDNFHNDLDSKGN